jgi:tetratricopeptide (TPR) repeat protein
MNRLFAFIVLLSFGFLAEGAWYWPFGSDDDKRKLPRISELMEPASVLIDEASDLGAEGKLKEAVAKYRQALLELDRIELENAERANKPEFATLRNKRAYVNAAIDSLLMSEVKENAKAVAVSDTTELEKKLALERGEKTAEKTAQKAAETTAPASAASPQSAKKAVKSKPRRKPANRNEQVIADIAAGEFEAAAIVIGEMLQEKPNGAAALNLKAALEMAQGKYKDAEKTLDRAIMSNPRSHYAYYNMARLVLQSRPDAKNTARRYYETGRAVGGDPDQELEGLIK